MLVTRPSTPAATINVAHKCADTMPATAGTTTRRALEMSAFPEVEAIHTVAGDTAMILKVRTENFAALERLLGKLPRLEGFKGVKTFIALGTCLARGPLTV
ncbi:Lrp/AsnC ligand binding domain-containing protein [Pseudomonas sp. GB2N2]